jgi:hypothetical protein
MHYFRIKEKVENEEEEEEEEENDIVIEGEEYRVKTYQVVSKV